MNFDFRWSKPLTTNEIVDIVNDIEPEEEVTAADIYIDPPGNGLVSDSDSGDETNISFENLLSRQLLAPAELVLRCISDDSDDDSSDSEDDIPLSEYLSWTSTFQLPSLARESNQMPTTNNNTALALRTVVKLIVQTQI